MKKITRVAGLIALVSLTLLQPLLAERKWENYCLDLSSACSADCSRKIAEKLELPQCAEPEDVVVTIAIANVHVSWSGGTGTYEVDMRPSGQLAWTTAMCSNPYYSFDNLQAGTLHEFRIRKRCSEFEWSTHTAIGSFVTHCPTPTNFSVTSIAAANATVSWIGSSTGTYIVEYTPTGGVAQYRSVSGTSVALSGLQAGTNYQVRASRQCAMASSSISTATSFSTVCPIVSISVDEITPYSAKLLWTQASAGSSYRVEWKRATTISWAGTNTSDPYSNIGLVPSTSYVARVRTICPNGIVPAWSQTQFWSAEDSEVCPPYDPYCLNSITLSPNPASTELMISYSKDIGDDIDYAIVNSNGGKEKMGLLRNKIDVSSLRKGTYILRIARGNETRNIRFAKE